MSKGPSWKEWVFLALNLFISNHSVKRLSYFNLMEKLWNGGRVELQELFVLHGVTHVFSALSSQEHAVSASVLLDSKARPVRSRIGKVRSLWGWVGNGKSREVRRIIQTSKSKVRAWASELDTLKLEIHLCIFKTLFVVLALLGLHWCECKLSLVARSWAYSSWQRAGFSLWWLLLLWSMGSSK